MAKTLTNTSIAIFILILLSTCLSAQEEFKVKRETVFEFNVEPSIKKNGNTYEISFEAKSFCDVTVAIEDNNGKIHRHLASGVLGKNAPAPFAKDSLKQMIVWDGKNDQEIYLDNINDLSIRVSLGLKPQFEKTLYWSPHRRIEKRNPLLYPTENGMVIYEGGNAMDFIKIYNHDGSYQSTIYPIAANKIATTKGLLWHEFPQDGKSSPIKGNFLQNTMLTSGDNAVPITYKSDQKEYVSVVSKFPKHYGMHGNAASGIAVFNKNLAIVNWKLNRLSIDGSELPLSLEGPKTSISAADRTRYTNGLKLDVGPSSVAFSPDGKWLYMTGYSWATNQGTAGYWKEWLNCVTRIKYDGSGEVEMLIGSDKLDDIGTENNKLNTPTSLQIDSKGNLYVTDYMNNRIQVFDLDGKYKRTINVNRPVNFILDEKKNEFYVGSWFLKNNNKNEIKVEKPLLIKYANIENPKEIQTYELSFDGYIGSHSAWDQDGGEQYRVVVNIYGKEPNVWVIAGSPRSLAPHEMANATISPWEKFGLKIYSFQDKNLKLEKDFGKIASQEVARLIPPLYYRQKIYVNAKTGNLYLWEGQNEDGTGAGKGSQELIEINTKTGESKKVPLPFDAEDIAFDSEGMIYLKSVDMVARFQMSDMKEIPWDYGMEKEKVGFASGRMGKQRDLVSGLKVPADLNWQNGGMYVSSKGDLVIACYLSNPNESKEKTSANSYMPNIYPGRAMSHSHGGTYIHIWDKHGKPKAIDAVPGLAELDGVGIDNNGSLYVMTHATRIFDNKRYYNDLSGTLLKFAKGKGRVLSQGGKSIAVEIPKENSPKRSFDLVGDTGGQWVEDSEWMYGGVGYGGKNKGVGCACWNARYVLDDYARSFAPEVDRYKVAVLDSNGNLILRIGQYGNIDDGKPLDLNGGPKNPRSIGGDEVALFHGAFLATESDHFLYVADPGNLRILKVKLGYHQEKKMPLKQ